MKSLLQRLLLCCALLSPSLTAASTADAASAQPASAEPPAVQALKAQAESEGPFHNVAAMHALGRAYRDGEMPGLRRDHVAALEWFQRYDVTKAAQIKALGKKAWDALCVQKREHRSTSGDCRYTDKRSYDVEHHARTLNKLELTTRSAQSDLALATACEAGQCPDDVIGRAYQERNRPHVLLNIAKAYDTGTGFSPDDGEALRWYRLAAETGSPVAMYRLGQMHAEGRGGAADPAAGLQWLEQARATMGQREAHRSDDRNRDALTGASLKAVDTAISKLKVEMAANADDPEAMFKRGMRNRTLHGGLDDEHYAWVVRAADAGHVQAAWQLRNEHTYRNHINRQNEQKAAQWRDRAAELGHAEALLESYLAYRNSPTPEEQQRARNHLQKSADLGFAKAQLALGKNLKGDNREASLRWLRLAAASTDHVAAKQAQNEIEAIIDPTSYERRMAREALQAERDDARQAAVNAERQAISDRIAAIAAQGPQSQAEVDFVCQHRPPSQHSNRALKQDRSCEQARRSWDYGQADRQQQARRQKEREDAAAANSDLAEFGRKNRARSECLARRTESLQRAASGQQSWVYAECD